MDTITKEHELAQSQNVVADNIDKLKQLFPEIITEGKIDFEALRAVLGEHVEKENERYQFTWHGKARAMREAHKTSTGTLRPCPEESVNWDSTQNLYIEGDNLEVLKLLQKSYHGRVKMIYIDPPYNTGKDFVYKDNYNDNLKNYLELTQQGKEFGTNTETSGRYHSNWLNMMYPRLKLARHLLHEDGVIYISVDDNEVHNLKKACDEIFGENSFIGQISRATGTPTGQGTTGMVSEIDYILVYAKSPSFSLKGLPFTKEDQKIYNQEDSKGKYLTRPLRKTGGEDKREDRPSMFFPIVAPNGENVYPIGPGGYESRWRCSKDKYAEFVNNGLIEWKSVVEDSVPKWKPYLKFYLDGRLKLVSNLWDNIEGNKKASTDLKKLLGVKAFDFPKPIELIQRCIQISTDDGDLIVDFFSGSGTTAQAVIGLNSENGGTRKFICVQIPEAIPETHDASRAGFTTIADIGKERLRRVIRKIEEEPDKSEQLDLGFKVFKLDSSNIKEWDPSAGDIQTTLYDSVNNIKEDRTEADILFEVLLKYGLDLTLPIEEYQVGGNTVFSIGRGILMVCLSPNLNPDTIAGIGELKEDLAPEMCRVVLRDNGFKDDVAKTNAMQVLKRYGIEDVKSI